MYMNKKIIEDYMRLIEGSEFYNKIQLVNQGDSEKTETFYFVPEGIGHAILQTNSDGSVDPIQDTEMIDKDFVFNRLNDLSNIDKFVIAGNNGENLITVKIR